MNLIAYQNKYEKATGKAKRSIWNSFVKDLVSRPSDMGYYGDNEDMFTSWTLGPIIEHRDSSLLDQSNAASIVTALESHPEFNDQWEINPFSHWAYGWVNHLSFKVFDEINVLHTVVRRITPIALFIIDLYTQMDSYPVLNEDDYSEREYNATLENTENELSYVLRKFDIESTDDVLQRVINDLYDSGVIYECSNDDSGYYPSEQSIIDSLETLGIKEN